MEQKRGRGTNFSFSNSLLKNRGGQFFLIAAVVIIVVVVSIVTVSNYMQKKEVVKLYDLGEELGIESQHVLDWGTYNELDETEMKELMENFIHNYVEYMGEGKNLYFIFGNQYKISVVGYQEEKEKVEVCLEESSANCPVLEKIGGEAQEFGKGGEIISKVVIRIGEIDYQFPLNRGENFYFVIWQEIGGGKHVVTSGTGE